MPTNKKKASKKQPPERLWDMGDERHIEAREKSAGEIVSMDVALDDAAPTRSISPAFEKYEIAKRIAHTLALSSLVPDAYRGRPNDVFVAINMGAELGLEPFQAIQSIAVIDGKPCLYGDGLIGVVRASPLCLWIEESISDDNKAATCRTQRKGDPNPISATYTFDDAVQAGIHTKNNWKKHTKRMLQMRARAYCLRDAYPDLMKGLGVVEEMIDHENTPAPITDYQLPTPVVAAPIQTEGDAEKVTLAEVEKVINAATDMASLLKAAKFAELLTHAHEISTARMTFKKKRASLKAKLGSAPETDDAA